MLVAFAVSFFILGFGAAILGRTSPEKVPKVIDNLIQNVFQTVKILSEGKVSKLGKTAPTEENYQEQQVAPALLTKSDVEEQFEVGTWQRIAYEEFKSTILAKERTAKKFPCIYATKGYRANDHRYVFAESDNPSEPRNLHHIGPAIRTYLSAAHSLGPNTSLVIICAPGDDIATVEDYTERFWNFLRGLRICDTKPWPSNVPADTNDEQWTFCFNGEPIFPIALTPAHEKRRSRYASNLIIAMQPKWVIDNLMSTPEKRVHATTTVRGLLRDYDDVDVSPDLANFGEKGASEGRQLVIRDDNEAGWEIPFKNMDK